MKVNPQKYLFSFTASSLKIKETVLIADSCINGTELNIAEVLGSGKTATGERHFHELKKRIDTLTYLEKELLINEDFITQKQICFLAVCKTYSYIRDFVVEVLRNKVLVFDFIITDGEYLSFFRRKKDEHEEMESLTENTEYKLRQVIFKILEQAGIIDSVKTKVLQPQFLSTKLSRAIVDDNPDLLKIFLKSDLEIKQIIND